MQRTVLGVPLLSVVVSGLSSGAAHTSMVSARPRTARTRREKANARERSRMHGQNAVLMRLLRCLPLSSERGAAHKLSKIEILRLAINYLCVLQRLLLEGEDPVDALSLPALLASLTPGLSRATASRLDAHRLLTPPTPAPTPWGPWDVAHPHEAPVLLNASLCPLWPGDSDGILRKAR